MCCLTAIFQANLPSASATPTQAVVSQYIPLCRPNLQQWSSSHIYLVCVRHMSEVLCFFFYEVKARRPELQEKSQTVTLGKGVWGWVALHNACLQMEVAEWGQIPQQNPCWTYLLYVYNMISMMSLKPEFRSDSVLLSNHTHSMTTCTTKNVTNHSEQEPINNSLPSPADIAIISYILIMNFFHSDWQSEKWLHVKRVVRPYCNCKCHLDLEYMHTVWQKDCSLLMSGELVSPGQVSVEKNHKVNKLVFALRTALRICLPSHSLALS